MRRAALAIRDREREGNRQRQRRQAGGHRGSEDRHVELGSPPTRGGLMASPIERFDQAISAALAGGLTGPELHQAVDHRLREEAVRRTREEAERLRAAGFQLVAEVDGKALWKHPGDPAPKPFGMGKRLQRWQLRKERRRVGKEGNLAHLRSCGTADQALAGAQPNQKTGQRRTNERSESRI
jgi:hypothetical protein